MLISGMRLFNLTAIVRYIGRKDTQIKLNGQRIEVGEIEHHIESNLPTDILSAVDIVSPLNSARKALCVFFCTTSNMPTSSTEAIIANSPDLLLPFGESDRSMAKALESKLASVLPSYMIPTLFVPVRRLPWNASGKLDRNLLKGLIGGISVRGLSPYRLADLSHKQQPSGPAEQALQRAWSAVLGQPLSSIGADDSWFRLGGDSVSSMRLVAAARQEGIIISVADVMKTPKLSDMALTSQFSDGRSSPLRAEAFSLLNSDEPIEQILQECLYSYGVDEQAIQDAYPASPLQQAFITLSEKQPGAYVAQNLFRLAPSIDILRLKRAWQQVIDDLDILRTRIVQTGTGNFVQVVLKAQEIEWTSSETVESLSDYTLEIPPHNGGPLAAYAIVEEAISGDRFFVWTIHHSVYDGWSMPLILDRLEEIYFEGKSQLSTPPFSSFIEYLGKTSPEKSRGFWKSRLLEVTPDHFPPQPRPDEEPNFLEIRHSWPLRKTTGSNITSPTLIRAAWALLLSAYSHSEDVIFGETLSGRDINLENITHLVGPVLTTVPMRFQIDRNQSVSNFLSNVFQNTLSAIDHQHYGLAQIKRIDEYCSAACDFQNLLVIQTGEDQGESRLWTPTIADGSSSTFFTYPLVLECTAGSSAVSTVAHYNANVISSFQMQRMLWQLETIFGQLSDVHAAGTKLNDLNTFSAEDFKSLKEWNAAEPVIIEDTLDSVFSRQVSRRPKAVAISAHDGEFTYAELSNEASKVCNYLRKLGVGPRTFVPVCLEKSKWMMVAILGVVFAGGAYVPLDPQHPVSRHHEIIKDVQASVILCSSQHQDLYSDLAGTTLFEVGESTISSLPSLDRRSTIPYSSRPSPKDPLYVIYTSGSTGRPKGVVIEHQSFCSSALAMCQAFRISEDTRAFQFASLVFDASGKHSTLFISNSLAYSFFSDGDPDSSELWWYHLYSF
jgi:non-ribosomal peptide synthetase component F/aryl carrier-like protein